MRENRDDSWRKLKLFAGLVAMAFAVMLTLIVGNRLSDKALAVLAGAVCGVGAAIPTSLIVVVVSQRRGEPRDWNSSSRSVQPPMPQQRTYPPVIVVSPQGGQQWPNQWNNPKTVNSCQVCQTEKGYTEGENGRFGQREGDPVADFDGPVLYYQKQSAAAPGQLKPGARREIWR